MPDIDLIYEQSSMVNAMPRGGKVRLGDPKQTNSRGQEIWGRNNDHFRFAPDPELRDEQQDQLVAAWNNLYGEFPDRLENILVVGGHVKGAFELRYRSYFSNQVTKIRCNGKYQERWWSEADKKWLMSDNFNQPPCEWDHHKKECRLGCALEGRLHFFIPEFCEAVGWEFWLEMVTHGKSNFRQIIGELNKIMAARGGFGLTYCYLQREQHAMPVPVKGKPAKVDQWLVGLHTHEALVLEALEQYDTFRQLPDKVPTDWHYDEQLTLTTEEAKTRLGTGDKPRRIDTGANGTVNGDNGNGHPSNKKAPPKSWTADASQWSGFLKLARKCKSGMKETTIMNALRYAKPDDNITGPADWRGSRFEALGAVIAYCADYSAEFLEMYAAPELGAHRDIALEYAVTLCREPDVVEAEIEEVPS